MIVVDTSALIAVVTDEPEAEACSAILDREDEILVSAGTLTEAMIIADRRNVSNELKTLVDKLPVTIIPLSKAGARRAADAHMKWGRGSSRAKLNFGDCFAYALAEERGAPLLFIGDDFRRTDIDSAL